QQLTDHARKLLGPVHHAGAGVVDPLAGIFRAAGEEERQADIFAVNVFVGAVGFGIDRDRAAFDDAEGEIAHHFADRGAADVKAAAEDAARADDDRIEAVHGRVSVHQMLGANFGGGVKIVAADGTAFPDDAGGDLAALVGAEGADVDDAA